MFSVSFRVGKMKLHHGLSRQEKYFWSPTGKIHRCPPGKYPSEAHARINQAEKQSS